MQIEQNVTMKNELIIIIITFNLSKNCKNKLYLLNYKWNNICDKSFEVCNWKYKFYEIKLHSIVECQTQ